VGDGHTVVCARNGAEGLVALNRLPRPALILLDLHMLVADGVTLLDHLRQRPDQADFEVISCPPSSIRSASASCPVVSEFAERRPGRRHDRRNATAR